MYPSFHNFSEALSLPEIALRSLGACEVVLNGEGLPALRRTSMTLEAEILLDGRRYLLALPLTAQTARRMERSIAALERLRHPAWPALRLLPDELRWQDSHGNPMTATLILEELCGEPLEQVIREIEPTQLNRAIETLRRDLQQLEVAHNNLKIENLHWHANRLVPIRPWFATLGGDPRRDELALEALYDSNTSTSLLSDCEADYEADPQPGNIRWMGHEFEGLICFETDDGYGYMDRNEQIVIEPHYLWAEDFHEGRAVVESKEGMGLIDRTGSYILPPEFEMVEYLYAESIVRASKAGLWATFDITGQQTSPFVAEEEE